MRIRIRYDTVDERGQTRRERNDAHGHETPPLEIPLAGQHIWDFYETLNDRMRRVMDRQAIPISFSELHVAMMITGTLLNRKEIEILFEMDKIFCELVNLELKDLAEREKEEQAKKRGRP